MSTKTNFKRIALVAVAALGMGVLSSVPSNAVFSGTAGSQLTLTATAGGGGLTGSASDSTTASTVTVSGLALTAITDSYTVTAVNKSRPTAAVATPALLFTFIDTATSTSAATVNGSHAGRAGVVAMNTTTETATTAFVTAGAAAGYVNSKFFAFMDSATARVAGTYVYTVVVSPFSGTAATAGTPQTIDVTYTVAALASSATAASPANSTLTISAAGSSTDENLAVVATASNTAVGVLRVTLKNASNTTSAAESVTITTTLGQVGTSSNRGRSVVLAYTAGGTDYNIYADGTAGVGVISVSTPSVTFATKSITFYSVAAKTLTSTVAHPQLLVGANSGAVRTTAVDAGGVVWGGQAYIVASSAADAAVAGSTTPVACTWNATFSRHDCPITGVTAGTAKLKVIDAATVALATATSNEVTVTVNVNAVASVKLSFDKASYAPNERMRIYVTPVDSKGSALPANTYSNLFAAGGISANAGFSGASETTTATSIVTVAADSSSTGAKAGSFMYTVYAPAAGGTVTITATGGTSLPLAAQVATTATATVTDSGAAALAAVTALATTVASLKTLITTLTNLVLKIQKKVKA